MARDVRRACEGDDLLESKATCCPVIYIFGFGLDVDK